jgi:hypothetical protein
MAEDAVESAGAKAPAITFSTQQSSRAWRSCHQTTDAQQFIPHLRSGPLRKKNVRIAGNNLVETGEERHRQFSVDEWNGCKRLDI